LNYNENDSAEYGISPFTDLTPEEFKTTILMPPAAPTEFPESRFKARSSLRLKDLPDSFDWNDKGAVTPIKDQGSCGTCWAFSTTGNIEGIWHLAGNKLVGISEEQIVDCDGSQDV